MEYFDFDDAANNLPQDCDDFSSTYPEANEGDAQSCFEALFFEKSSSLPTDQPVFAKPSRSLMVGPNSIEVELHPDDFDGVYPMFRAKIACDLCRQMGMNCFIAQRGALQNGCSCCISLYRECSFTHRKQPGLFLNTLGQVPEDVQTCEGSMTCKRALKSLGEAYEDSRPRKNGARFCRDAVKVLKQWLADHADHPYPTDQEKDELKHATGLKRSQISNWLANARRRGKVRPLSTPSSPVLGAIDIPCRVDNNNSDLQNMSPLERWKQSPPEHEAASATAIARAVAQSPFPGRNSSHSSLHGSRQGSRKSSSNDDSSYSMFQAPSISSLETGRSSTSDISFASNRSHRSRGSLASSSFDQKDRRRRRRPPIAQRAAAAQTTKTRAARIFQCTFCTDTFSAKYDWQRHEKSLHLALERWTCCPSGGAIQVDGQSSCAFCRDPKPTRNHLESHNFMACQEKTLSERTFYRKDHLRQHLKLAHGVKFDSSMECWKSTTSEVKSSCGFCPQEFFTWQQRADHLAAHFRNGCDMSTWKRGWGFEPYVERLVENAIPPYLIAHERMTMDPFVAKRGMMNTTPISSAAGTNLTFGTSAPASDTTYRVVEDSNCWRRLEQQLSAYILQQKKVGVIPTDQMLQEKARWVVFDSADPWNQTSADNLQWLQILKQQHGIADQGGRANPAENAAVGRLEELPLLPPYAVKGGLKHGRGGIMNSGAGVSAQTTTSTTINSSSSPGLTSMMPAISSSLPPLFVDDESSSLDPSAAMDLDFDNLDFSNLDLGLMVGDLSMEQHPTRQQHYDNLAMVVQNDFDMMDGEGAFGLGPAAGRTAFRGAYGADGGTLKQKKQSAPPPRSSTPFNLNRNSARSAMNTMSMMTTCDDDLDQLQGYMASFH